MKPITEEKMLADYLMLAEDPKNKIKGYVKIKYIACGVFALFALILYLSHTYDLLSSEWNYLFSGIAGIAFTYIAILAQAEGQSDVISQHLDVDSMKARLKELNS